MGSGWLNNLCTAVRTDLPPDAAEDVLQGCESQDEKDSPAFSQWLLGVMQRFEAAADADTRRKVMKQLGYGCAIQHEAHIKDKKVVDELGGLDAFFAHARENPERGVTKERDGDTVAVTYHPGEYGCRCYCGPWQALPEDTTAPLSYCWCSAGHVEYIWRHITGKQIDVDLHCSRICGADTCRFTFSLDAPPKT